MNNLIHVGSGNSLDHPSADFGKRHAHLMALPADETSLLLDDLLIDSALEFGYGLMNRCISKREVKQAAAKLALAAVARDILDVHEGRRQPDPFDLTWSYIAKDNLELAALTIDEPAISRANIFDYETGHMPMLKRSAIEATRPSGNYHPYAFVAGVARRIVRTEY